MPAGIQPDAREARTDGTVAPDRDVIFISHATPNDNEFVRWLGTRLTSHGYKVWADIFDLSGGTPFWVSIEEALRKRALKVIFVVSKASCDPGRSGVRNEISVAEAIKKTLNDPEFIIPVRIDDVPFDEFPIQIHQLNAIDFTTGWGAKLAVLVDTLTKAKVPRTVTDLGAEFDRWRKVSVRSDVVVERSEEPLLTSILPVLSFPDNISFYEYDGEKGAFEDAVRSLPHPSAMHHRLLVSFAAADEIQARLPPGLTVALRGTAKFRDFLDGAVTDPIGPKWNDANNWAVRMLRESFEAHLAQRGLLSYGASAGTVMFFPKDLLPEDRVYYVNAKGKRTYKQIVGFSKVLNAHWHLGMRAVVRLGDVPTVRLRPYVVFSRDGKQPLKDPEEMTKLRRRFCKSWFNHVWRPLWQAFFEFFGNGADAVQIALGGDRHWSVAGRGLKLVAAMGMPLDLAVSDDEALPEEPDEIEDDVEYSDNGDDA